MSTDPVLDWAGQIVGSVDVATDVTGVHPDGRSRVLRLRTRAGDYALESYASRDTWSQEVHALEVWAPSLGIHAPALVAVRDEDPPAIVRKWLPGAAANQMPVSIEQELLVWRAAGRALASLHVLPPSASFGPCDRNGAPVGTPIDDARAYASSEFEAWIERGERRRCLGTEELAFINAARDHVAVFAGERATACHRDWCPANWIVDESGWAGAIDWEFAYPDLRAADVSRYPSWEWMARPELIEAFDDGYASVLTPVPVEQRVVARTLYAVTAIVWGRETGYAGFEREGHDALARLRIESDEA